MDQEYPRDAKELDLTISTGGASVPLKASELKTISWIEVYWNRHGKFPAINDIEKNCPCKWSNLKNHPTFRLALKNRGIRVKEYNTSITPIQVATVAVLADYNDKRTRGAKFSSLGLSTSTFNGWMKDQTFKDYYHRVISVHFDDALDLAQDSLIKAVARGDTSAIKFYYELTGRYNPRGTEDTANIKLMVAKLVEAVQYHVVDPAVLRKIGADFETVISGGTVPRRAELEGTTQVQLPVPQGMPTTAAEAIIKEMM